VKLETDEVQVQGDVLIEVGRYALLAPTGAAVDAGKYVVVWKSERGGWRLDRDIWTTSQPSPKT
jgi:ketosteroid isomerase-like protein